jgi:AP-1 complex subunit beta-1
LEIISSAVKIYLKFSNEFETLITDLLTIATEDVDNPDVRDRAFIYWRMLSTDPEKAKNVVFGKRPPTKDNDKLVDPQFLNEMMKSLGYTSSLFEKLPGELFQKSLAELKGIKLDKEENSMMGEHDEPQLEMQKEKSGKEANSENNQNNKHVDNHANSTEPKQLSGQQTPTQKPKEENLL